MNAKSVIRLFCTMAVLVLFVACSGGSGEDKAPSKAEKPATPAAAAEKSAQPANAKDAQKAGIQPAAKETVEKKPAFLTTVFGVKREPVKDRKIDKPDGKGKVSNWVATLYRGESIMSMEESGEYTKVEDSNGNIGWVESRYLVTGDAVKPACTDKDLETFDRPDMIALNGKRGIKAGTLVFMLEEKEPFVKVNFTPTQTAWVLKQRLIVDEKEINTARFIEKLRYLKRKGKKEELAKTLDLIKKMMADTALAKVAEAEFGATEPAESGKAGEGENAEAK